MGRPRPFLGGDGRWHDPVRGFKSPKFMDARDAENRRIMLQRIARTYEAEALFYRAIERELADERVH